jgi:hypothetical protein
MNAMKTLGLNRMLSLFFAMTGWTAVYGQGTQSEVPGDNFSLEGALELFKKSASPQEFEQMLNSPDSKVNNLDLNGDGYTDYIKVIDRNEGNVHAFILQDVVSETENQDVAVIELQKLDNGKAVLQIIGDEDIYGIETIIEPTQEVRTYAGTTTSHAVVNVWAWPSVQYIYGPYYSVWISPWGWGYQPYWWHTWRPVAYYVYDPWWQPYRHYYSVCYTHRVYYAQRIYRPYRTTSVYVHNRHNGQIAQYRSTHQDYHYDRNGRTRNDYGRSNAGQYNGGNHYDANRTQRSGSSQFQHRNPTSTISTRSSTQQSRQNVSGRSTLNRDDFSAANRSTTNFRNTPGVSQRNSSGLQSGSFSGTRSGSSSNSSVTRQPVNREFNRTSTPSRGTFSTPNRPSSGYKSTPSVPQQNSSGVNRDNISRMRSGSGNNGGTRPQITRPATSINRTGSSGHSNVQRSPSRSGGNSSGQIKRGRN